VSYDLPVSRALWIVALTAACGGGARESTAPEEPGPEAERQLAEIRARADRACTCEDRVCARDLDAELEEAIRAEMARRAPGALVHDDPGTKQEIEEVARMYRCIGAHGVTAYSFGVFVQWKLDGIKERACTCTDASCLAEAATDWDGVLAEFAHAPGSPKTRDAITKINAAAQLCFVRGFARATEDALREMRALREVACACDDVSCAGVVERAFEKFIAKHKDTRGAENAMQSIFADANEMRECLSELRGDAATLLPPDIDVPPLE